MNNHNKKSMLRGAGAMLAASLVCGAGLIFTALLPATAHHSVAGYDLTRQVTIKGTVREFDWENPHVWLWIDVPNPSAPSGVDAYGIESSSPGALRRAGLKWDSFRTGQVVTVSMWPLRDGRKGGGLANAVWADGHSWHPTGQASPLPPGVAPTTQAQPAPKTYNGSVPGVP